MKKKFFQQLAALIEAGKRNSSNDQGKIQAAHDQLVGLGATCAAPMSEAAIDALPLSERKIALTQRKNMAEAALAAAKKKLDGIADPEPLDEATELAGSDYAQLREGAVSASGLSQIKIIAPGWGSSGFYPAAVLERDGPKIFKSGTKMFWNHQTAVEEANRPEGDIDDLAAELTTDARWMPRGPEGAGLYADAKVFSGYQESLNELAPSIGVSIRAMGRAKEGEAEGKKGLIIESLAAVKSIDFVTSPGAGGKVLSLFEAARGRKPKTQNTQETEVELAEAKALTDRIAALEATNAQLTESHKTLSTGAILNDARTYVAGKLATLAAALPAMSQARLAESLVIAPPVKDNRLDLVPYDLRITEAVKAEAAYVAAITGSGTVKGMGTAPSADDTKSIAESEAALVAAFADLGLKESTAKLAAAGRK